jgi:hypothetical protein
MEYDDDIREIFEAMILFIIISELSKAPQYVCEYCMRSYKQESWYRSHIQQVHNIQQVHSIPQVHNIQQVHSIPQVHNKPNIDDQNKMNESIDEIKQPSISSSSTLISVDVVTELLKQNRDMLDMIKQQQDTICALLRHNKMMV